MGFWDSLLSGNFSDAGSSLWDAVPEASDVGDLLLGSTPKGSATGPDESKGFFEELLTPKNIISGLGIYGQYRGAEEKKKLAQPLSPEEQAAADAQSVNTYLAKLKGELELKKEYGLLGGGGGGGGDPYARAREIYLGKLRAMENQGTVGNNAASLTVDALKNMSNIGHRIRG